jgi:L-fuculose-phosphate aldolase
MTLKEIICEIGKRIYDKGFVAANDGNISIKLPDGTVLCTPTGVSKGFMTLDMVCRVDMDGNILESSGDFKPSSEVFMHLRVYRERPDVNAVVHAHPPYATAYAIAHIPLFEPIMPEAVIMLGCVPIVPYGTPSTSEIPDAVAPYLPHFDALLLANHGALSFGADIYNAYHKMESLEFYAKLSYLAKNLGGAQQLDTQQVSELYGVRKRFNMSGNHPMDICGVDCPFKEKKCHS